MINGHPPATGPQILESVRSLHEAVDLLSKQMQQLGEAVRQQQITIRSEQEHTRRALLMHFSGEDLVREHGG